MTLKRYSFSSENDLILVLPKCGVFLKKSGIGHCCIMHKPYPMCEMPLNVKKGVSQDEEGVGMERRTCLVHKPVSFVARGGPRCAPGPSALCQHPGWGPAPRAAVAPWEMAGAR